MSVRAIVLPSFLLGVVCFAPVARADSCVPKTSCSAHAGYYAPSDDLTRMTAVTDPVLQDVRACLDTLGGQNVTPAVVMRWNAEGNPVEVRVEAPGYEGAPCVAKAAAKLSVLQNPRETSIRCELGCPRAAASTPAPPPVVMVVPPSAPPATAPEAQPPPPPYGAPPPSPEPRPERHEKVWYGWQTLVSDGVSATATLLGYALDAGGLGSAGLAGLYLGTPIVHMAHGNVGRGFGSLGIRLLLPPVAVGVGALSGLIVAGTAGSGKLSRFGSDANGPATGAVVGGLLGVVGCSLIDAAAFAYKKERVDEGATAARTSPVWTLAPTLEVGKERTTVGFAGQF